MDMLVQLAICYICWTMGSSARLRNVKCVIVPNEDGNHQIQFRSRQSVTATADTTITTESSQGDSFIAGEAYLE